MKTFYLFLNSISSVTRGTNAGLLSFVDSRAQLKLLKGMVDQAHCSGMLTHSQFNELNLHIFAALDDVKMVDEDPLSSH